MTPLDLAIARGRAYQLFSRLYLEGLTPDLHAQLQIIPDLYKQAEPFDVDEAAAAHYTLTAAAVFPYESIFRDPSGLLGGPVTDELTALYSAAGFQVLSDSDHIGHELAYLAHLSHAQAGALSAADESAAVLWQNRQQAFLAAHLLPWMPPFLVAVEQGADRFYTRLAQLTLELLAEHVNLTGAAAQALPASPPFAAAETSLKEIARYLTTPPYSGIFLSREAIAALARRHKLPRGFGDRAQMLTNLLRTAGQYDLALSVFADLEAVINAWQSRYAELPARYPGSSAWVRPWHDRTAQTAAALQSVAAEMKTVAEASGDAGAA